MKIPLIIEHGRNRGKLAGEFDTETKTFEKTIYYKKQTFIQPKYRNFIFISENILKRLKEKGCKYFKFLMVGLEERAFWIVIDFNVYMKNAIKKIEFENDFQLGVYISLFTRIYLDQTKILIENV